MDRLRILIFIGVLLLPTFAFAEDFTVKGNMDSAIRFELHHRIKAGDAMKKLMLSFVVPESFDSPTYRQQITNFHVEFSPRAEEQNSTTDQRGNRIIEACWYSVPQTVDATISFDAKTDTGLKPIRSDAPFPLASSPDHLKIYLEPTEQVQSHDPAVRALAQKLTRGAKTQFEAVEKVVSWVVDHVRYINPPEEYDALYTLKSGKGNCQNYSHLTAAFLRSVHVPVRIVNGVTMNMPFNVSWQKGTLTFKMGQGRHSWVEIWFPDQGWVPYDPQNMQFFISNRFVRIEVGMDNQETKNDGLVRWIQSPGALAKPTLQETIGGHFVRDSINVTASRRNSGPKNMLLGPQVYAKLKEIEAEPPLPVPEPARPKPKPEPKSPPPEILKPLRFTVPFVFGNLQFPENVDFAFPRVAKARGRDSFEMARNFLVETAEFVTQGVTQYAQAVVMVKPVRLDDIALALHNFGGDGHLWVDVLKDDDGQPGEPLWTTQMMGMEEISGKPGYRWVNFKFQDKKKPVLTPGTYWIALGFSGTPVVNWFYTYGKPVGPVYGTRYKSIFERQWSGALNYEFNYRLAGMTTK